METEHFLQIVDDSHWRENLKVNILITNVGRRGYLVDYIKAIEDFEGKVFVSDCSNSASGLYGANDGFFILPKPIDDEKLYVERLTKLCQRYEISLVIPVIDPEISILAKYVDTMKKKGINVVVSSEKVLSICYNKLNMNNFLVDNGFEIPATYVNYDDLEAAIKNGKERFPVILKPVFGSGSEETYTINNLEQANSLYHNGLFFQEKLFGQEYGIDILNDLHKNPVRCTIKKKLLMRAGETDKAITIWDENLQNAALQLSRELGHIGNLDCDVMVSENKIYFLDLNPRIGGGYPITHVAGQDYISLLIQMYNGKKIIPCFNNYKTNFDSYYL